MSLPSQELHEFLRSRRSVRRFQPMAVPPEVLARVLETAATAPSAHNRQPWRFAVLTSSPAKIRLADAMGADFHRDLLADGQPPAEAARQVARSRQRILGAPAVVILCLIMADMDTYPDQRRQRAEVQMAVQSVALAGGTMLLAAHAEGLGGVWVCAPLFAQQAVRRALGLPADWEAQGMLLLGYPAHVPEPKPRKSTREITRFI